MLTSSPGRAQENETGHERDWHQGTRSSDVSRRSRRHFPTSENPNSHSFPFSFGNTCYPKRCKMPSLAPAPLRGLALESAPLHQAKVLVGKPTCPGSNSKRVAHGVLTSAFCERRLRLGQRETLTVLIHGLAAIMKLYPFFFPPSLHRKKVDLRLNCWTVLLGFYSLALSYIGCVESFWFLEARMLRRLSF